MTDKYPLRPTGLGGREDDFVFRFNGRDVGRTYAENTPAGRKWYWAVYGINLRAPIPESILLQGLADDLEGAQAAFKESFEQLRAAGRVRMDVRGS